MENEDECPICHDSLPPDNDGTNTAAEKHINDCIQSRLSTSTTYSSHPSQPSGKVFTNMDPPSQLREEDECPICHMSLLGKQFDGNESVREAHVAACIESQQSSSSTSKADPFPPAYDHTIASSASNPFSASAKASPFEAPPEKPSLVPNKLQRNAAPQTGAPMQQKEDREVSSLRRWFSTLGGDSKTKEQKTQDNTLKADNLMTGRWGPPGSPAYDMVMRYWVATRMVQHWEYLHGSHPRQFKRFLTKGYMEPIPTSWVQSRRLAYPYPEGSYWETPAEKRLYYLLNNGITPDGSKHAPMRPLNILRDRNTIIRRGNERNARQIKLDQDKLAAYQSPGDVFQSDKQIQNHEYSAQVPNKVDPARTKALHELADGILHGTDHLETMLLIDVSGSMTWNPHGGIRGPDGMMRYHDQPSNIVLVNHIVHRVLHHMIPRAQREHANQKGIETVTFSTQGNYIGQLSATSFQRDWASKVRLGGGTQVMQGWQVVKNTYFRQQHASAGHGRWDNVYGWQPTPGMPKLSLLVFLDGEANDMDEFELELLGETWAYVTIALVGMENCPHHHSHAIELERVAHFNPHVGFYDVHGRVCERMVVEDLLGSVYPVDPPAYGEILKPEYDIKPDALPAYSAY